MGLPVRFFAPDTDAYVDSVKRHAGEFTESTGARVTPANAALVTRCRIPVFSPTA
jgi:hypothetical protein